MSTEPKFTPGPWGWFGSTRTEMYLATVRHGRRYVLAFKRKGMNGAEPVFRVNDRMVPASKLAIYEVNREATDAKDPSVYRHDIVGFRSADASLIAAAPDLFHALTEVLEIATRNEDGEWAERARSALSKANPAVGHSNLSPGDAS